MMSPRRWPLAGQLTLVITLTTIALITGVTLLDMQREQQTFRNELQQQATLLLDTLAGLLADSLYPLDSSTLEDAMKKLSADWVVTFARVYDREGRIIADAHDPTLMRRLQSDAYGQQLAQSDSIIFDWQSDQLLAGRAVIVGNQRLGAISVGLPTDSLNALIAEEAQQGMSVALAAVVAGTLLAILFSRTVTHPLWDLANATHHITNGDLTYRIPVRGEDEFSVLAEAFNSMTALLREERQTLEQRVAERTRELAEAHKRAKELDRLKSKFVSDVSHELRTPVSNLMLHLHLLAAGKPEKREQYLKTLNEQAARLAQLIDDILDLSRLDLDPVKATFAPVDLNALIEQVVMTHRLRAEAAGLRLLFEPEAGLLPVWGVQSQLAQVVTNLVTNALNYTRAGTVRVSAHLAPERKQVCVQVQDTGVGIESGDLPYLFERFYRGQRFAQSNIPGTGLGLAIVKEIVDRHRGTVGVDSRIGEGSTFRVWLPLHERPAATEPALSGDAASLAARRSVVGDVARSPVILAVE